MKKLSILMILFILVCGVLASCGNPVTPPTVAPRTEPPVPETVLAEYAAEKLSFRILSVDVTATTLFQPVAPTAPTEKYLLVYVEVKNTSEEIVSVNSLQNFSLYVNGEKATQIFDADVYQQPDFPSVNPGDTKRGQIAYRLPIDAETAELALLADGTELTRVTLTVPPLSAPTATPSPAPTPTPTVEA